VNSKRPAKPGPTPRYTREHVLAVALEVIEAEPANSFALRKVADALDINVMTLYGYAKSKSDLLEGAALLALSRAHVDPDPDAAWDEQLGIAVRQVEVVCRQYPHLATLVIGRNAQAPGLFQIRERMLEILLGAGFESRSALRAMGVLACYSLGFAEAQNNVAGAGGTLPPLPAEDFPHLTALADDYAEHASDAAFEIGLDHLIDGLRRELQAQNRS